jgi:hypothetical protein
MVPERSFTVGGGAIEYSPDARGRTWLTNVVLSVMQCLMIW